MGVSLSGSAPFKRISRDEVAIQEYAKKMKHDNGQVELCLCDENYAVTAGNHNDGCDHFSKLRFGLKTVNMDDPDFMHDSIREWVHAVAVYLRFLPNLAHAPEDGH